MVDHLHIPPSPKKIRRTCLSIGVFVISACLLLYLAIDPKLLRDIEGRLLDARFQLRGPVSISNSVAIVSVDDTSIEQVGRWPWPRAKMAELLKGVNQQQPLAIGLDIVFSEPEASLLDKSSLDEEKLIPEFLEQLKSLVGIKNPDQVLADAIGNSGNVVTGYFFYTSPDSMPNAEEAAPVLASPVNAVKSKVETFLINKAYDVVNNIPVIHNAGSASGFFNIDPGNDGLVRKASLIMQYGEDIYPSLAISMLATAMDEAPIFVHAESYGVDRISVGDLDILTDEFGRIVINHLGPAKTIPTYSALDIINGRLPADVLQNKMVLVGVPAIGVSDLRSTSFSAVFPAVEIQAAILENIISENALTENNLANLTDTVTVVILSLLIAIVFPYLKGMLFRAIFAALLLFVYTALNYYLFVSELVWVNMTYPLLAWALTVSLIIVYLGVIVERTYSTVRGAFKSYLHPGLVDRLTQNPDLLKFGGEQKELTILFSDIRNFTPLSEKLTPQELARFLNCYMDPMTEIIFKNRGTLDKYIGDAVMAFFGAPYPSEIHPLNACNCALDMVDRLDTIKDHCSDLKEIFPIQIGIGIHTGETVVGNYGSSQRFNYTVLGDNVNLTSRLESLTKTYGVDIIVSESTYRETSDNFAFRELDRVRVKGKDEAISIFELVSRDAKHQHSDYLQDWHKAMYAYKNQQWQEALDAFHHVEQTYGEEKTCSLYLSRIPKYLKSPPSGSWDGVYTFTSK